MFQNREFSRDFQDGDSPGMGTLWELFEHEIADTCGRPPLCSREMISSYNRDS